MSTKFLTNAMAMLLGGLIVVLSMALASATVIGWVAFGIAIGIVAMSVFVQLDSTRGVPQRFLDVLLMGVSGTLIGVSMYFSGATITWLAFALGLGCVAVALAGLVVHEVETWRTVHGLGQLHWLRTATPTPSVRAETGIRAA